MIRVHEMVLWCQGHYTVISWFCYFIWVILAYRMARNHFRKIMGVQYDWEMIWFICFISLFGPATVCIALFHVVSEKVKLYKPPKWL